MSRVAGGPPPYAPAGSPDRLRAAFTGGDVPVAVYGLGKMGLPLAAVYADVCGNVVGADVDESVVRAVDAGKCPVEREPGLADLLADVVADGALTATADPAEAALRAAVHVVIVPTLLDGTEPDLSAVEAVAADVAWGLDPGDLVVVESTVPPGTCAETLEPALAAESDLDADEFGVAFCPERTASGRALRDVRGAYPKVVGGTDAAAGRAAATIYGEITDNEVIAVADATTAEAVKLFEGVYRDANVALANQLALFAGDLGVDATEAMAVANTQPFCDLHDPGPGVGGHCIPVYPYFLASRVAGPAPLLRTARAVNDQMPAYTAGLVRRALAGDGLDPADATVLVLGVTYRPGVAETRNAPALDVVLDLAGDGVDVLAADPLVEDPATVAPATLVPTAGVYDRPVDAVVVVTAHEEFTALDPDGFDAPVVDGRGLFDPALADVPVYRLGDGRRLPAGDDRGTAPAADLPEGWVPAAERVADERDGTDAESTPDRDGPDPGPTGRNGRQPSGRGPATGSGQGAEPPADGAGEPVRDGGG